MRLEIPALLFLSTLVAGSQVRLYGQPDCKGRPIYAQDQGKLGTCQEIQGSPDSVGPNPESVTEFVLVYSKPNCTGTQLGPFLGDNGDGKNCATGKSFKFVKAF